MRFQNIVFDRDGTLYDSLEVILEAFAYGIEPFITKQPTREEIIRGFGPAEPEVLARFIPVKYKQQAFNRFYDYYRKRFSEIHFYSGIRELLFRLKENGAKLMLFTGGGRVSTHFCLEQTGVLHLFDALICGEDVMHPKPDPEGILKLIKEQELDLAKSIVVGDAASDVEAGKSAGIFTAWLRWSVNSKATPPKIQPDFICDSVKDLEQVLLQEEKS